MMAVVPPFILLNAVEPASQASQDLQTDPYAKHPDAQPDAYNYLPGHVCPRTQRVAVSVHQARTDHTAQSIWYCVPRAIGTPHGGWERVSAIEWHEDSSLYEVTLQRYTGWLDMASHHILYVERASDQA